MIILEETSNQMVPSALSKRMKENRRRISFAFYTKKKSLGIHDKNDQSDSIASSILSQRWNISILNDINACICMRRNETINH